MKQAKGWKGKCDKLTSQIVRSKGYCERCGSRNFLNCSHVISRRYSNTRADLANVQCICSKCHIFFTANPVEFSKWVFSSIGEAAYEKLREKSQSTEKVDWEATYLTLKEAYAKLRV